MDIKQDYKSIFRGNWSAKLARFEDFPELIAEAARTGAQAPAATRQTRRYQRQVDKGSDRQFPCLGGGLDGVLARSANSLGEVQVGGRVYRLSRPLDQTDLVKGLQESYEAQRSAEGLVEEIICHDWRGTAPVCMSINTDTYLPSYDAAHVEHWPDSSYLTRFFDTQVNGKLTRVQLWKGHLLALNLTGAEISVWRPDTREVLQCSAPFRCRWVEQEYFGPIWFPYMDNQVTVSWDLIDRRTGAVFIGFGMDSSYEQQLKWWAGKWIKHSSGMAASKMGEDYTIRYVVRDATGIIANGQGEW